MALNIRSHPSPAVVVGRSSSPLGPHAAPVGARRPAKLLPISLETVLRKQCTLCSAAAKEATAGEEATAVPAEDPEALYQAAQKAAELGAEVMFLAIHPGWPCLRLTFLVYKGELSVFGSLQGGKSLAVASCVHPPVYQRASSWNEAKLAAISC